MMILNTDWPHPPYDRDLGRPAPPRTLGGHMSHDAATGRDSLGVTAGLALAERPRATTHWRVQRWDDDATRWVKKRSGLITPTGEDFMRLGVRPYNESEVIGNLVTNVGWTRLMNLLTNQGATQAYDATHTRIGVGNSSTAEAYTDTALLAAAGSANRWFQLVSAAGALGTRTLAWSATFGTADGNFAWNEFGIDQGTASGNTDTAPLLNRKAGIAQGTKASGQTWTATATLSFT